MIEIGIRSQTLTRVFENNETRHEDVSRNVVFATHTSEHGPIFAF